MAQRVSKQSVQKTRQAEAERFFKKIGLGDEKERERFQKFELPREQSQTGKYETRLTNDTEINHG